jgi:uncharacterized integral membrane protein
MPAQMPPRTITPTFEGTIRWLRIWYLILFLAIILCVTVAEKAQHQLIDMNRKFLGGLSVIAAIIVGAVLYVQVKTVRLVLEKLQSKPNDVASLSSWRSASLASYVMAEAVVLFGFCLRFLGAARVLALPFYGVGLVMMLFLFPRRP